MDYTFKFRNWALQKNYDSFVYANEAEGRGEDSYMTLTNDNIKERKQEFSFNKEMYLDTVAPKLDEFMDKVDVFKDSLYPTMVNGLYWAGHDPLQFWQPKL